MSGFLDLGSMPLLEPDVEGDLLHYLKNEVDAYRVVSLPI